MKLTFHLDLDRILSAIASGDLDDDLDDARAKIGGALRQRYLSVHCPLEVGSRVRIRAIAPEAFRGLEGTVRVVGRGMASIHLDHPQPSAPDGRLALPHFALEPILIGGD